MMKDEGGFDGWTNGQIYTCDCSVTFATKNSLGWTYISRTICSGHERISVWHRKGTNPLLLLCLRPNWQGNHWEGRDDNIVTKMSQASGTRRGRRGWCQGRLFKYDLFLTLSNIVIRIS